MDETGTSNEQKVTSNEKKNNEQRAKTNERQAKSSASLGSTSKSPNKINFSYFEKYVSRFSFQLLLNIF